MIKSVDIIIPIYNAYEDLVICLDSIYKNTDLNKNRLILINDNSPDPRIKEILDKQIKKNVIVIHNEVNKGFSNNINIGMSQSDDNDVILLNSDTVVTSNWVEKIEKCAYHDSAIGTVTPLSNNATLCSVPLFCEENKLPEGMSIEKAGQIVENCSLRKSSGISEEKSAIIPLYHIEGHFGSPIPPKKTRRPMFMLFRKKPAEERSPQELEIALQEAEMPQKGLKPFLHKNGKKLVAVLVIAAILVVLLVPKGQKKAVNAETAYTQVTPENRDITNVYSESGVLNAANSYTVKATVKGDVLTADFEVGDVVEKGAVLYTIDSSDVVSGVEKAELNLGQAQRSYDDAVDAQYIRTDIAGTVASFKVRVGDVVNAGQ